MSSPVYLFVLLELLLYLFVGFPLCFLFISLVFSLTIAKTAHLPKKTKVQVEGRGRVGGWKAGYRYKGVVVKGRMESVQIKSMNPKFLDWPNSGTPGSKWVTFMLPDADEPDVRTCWVVKLHRALAQYEWMWLFTGYLSTRNPLPQTPDSCVFLRKSAMKSPALIRRWMWNFCNINEWMSVVLFPQGCCKYALLSLISLANVSSGAHLRPISHTAIQFISTHNQSPVFSPSTLFPV